MPLLLTLRKQINGINQRVFHNGALLPSFPYREHTPASHAVHPSSVAVPSPLVVDVPAGQSLSKFRFSGAESEKCVHGELGVVHWRGKHFEVLTPSPRF